MQLHRVVPTVSHQEIKGLREHYTEIGLQYCNYTSHLYICDETKSVGSLEALDVVYLFLC